MSVIVTKSGFLNPATQADFVIMRPEDFIESGIPHDNHRYGLDVTSDVDPKTLVAWFKSVSVIQIPFPSLADGRGFSIAKALRDLGFEGDIRAKGHVIADQFPLALRCGITEVEIDDELAARQPEKQWLERANTVVTTYQDRWLGTA